MAGEQALPIAVPDVWSRWLLSRDGGSPAYQAVLDQHLNVIRDRVLDGAHLREGITLLDAGTGDGRLALGAIDRVGPSLKAICTDVSLPMLQHVKTVAEVRGVAGQCSFFACSAEAHEELWDRSVDVVVTRAVLAFVPAKEEAFKEFFRVLHPGGRLSISEPVLQDEALHAVALQKFSESSFGHPQAEYLNLLRRFKAAQLPSTHAAILQSPLTNYNERDLVNMAREAGFVDIHMELHIDVRPSLVSDWSVYLATSPHPLAPPSGEILAKIFNEDERNRFEGYIRPSVESGRSVANDVIAYLTATKPG